MQDQGGKIRAEVSAHLLSLASGLLVPLRRSCREVVKHNRDDEVEEDEGTN